MENLKWSLHAVGNDSAIKVLFQIDLVNGITIGLIGM